jgi:lipase chaperone LimK
VSRARTLGLGAAMVCIAASVFLWQTGQRIGQSTVPEVARGEGKARAGVAADPSAAIGTRSSAFAIDTSSLRGTEVDGSVSFDASGQVVLEPGLRRLFDYYLSLIGERDADQIRQLLAGHLLGRYGANQAQMVLKYFDRYVAYQQRLAETKIGDAVDPQERLEKAMALRHELLGDDMATAFFAEEEALAALTLKRMAIASDASLTAERKSERLAELDRSEGRTARAEADTASAVADQERRFERTHATASQRATEREALWGKEAAERLALLDEQRARWDARIEQYLFERSRIEGDRSLSPAARAQALAALRARHFDGAEQRRVASLEAIGQLKPGG